MQVLGRRARREPHAPGPGEDRTTDDRGHKKNPRSDARCAGFSGAADDEPYSSA